VPIEYRVTSHTRLPPAMIPATLAQLIESIARSTVQAVGERGRIQGVAETRDERHSSDGG